MSWWFKIDLWKRVIVALILGLACGLGLRYGMGAEAGGAFAQDWISWAGDLFLAPDQNADRAADLLHPCLWDHRDGGPQTLGQSRRPYDRDLFFHHGDRRDARPDHGNDFPTGRQPLAGNIRGRRHKPHAIGC